MKTLALTICACAACGVDDPPADLHPQQVTLPSDAWFGGVGPNDASVDDCIARQDPNSTIGIWPCSFEIVLCHSGRAGRLVGDIYSSGSYSMTGSVAAMTFDGYETETQLEVDISSGITVSGYPAVRWLPDIDQRWAHVEQFGFDCN